MGILMLNGNNYTGGIQQVYGKSSGNIATFDDGGDNKPLKSLKVAISPVQSGSGDPSPSNVRPISGWTGANIHRADGETPHIIDDTYNITWSDAGEVYGGYIDYERKKVVATHIKGHFNENNDWSKGGTQTDAGFNRFFIRPTPTMKTGNAQYGLCDKLPVGNLRSITQSVVLGYSNNTINVLSNAEDVPSFKAEIESIGELDIYYPLATPIEYDLDDPAPIITTLLGDNNIWSDTGEIVECVYQRDLNIVINQFDERITALEQALNSSGTRSLSLSKSAVNEEETKEITEEPKEEEQNEDKR